VAQRWIAIKVEVLLQVKIRNEEGKIIHVNEPKVSNQTNGKPLFLFITRALATSIAIWILTCQLRGLPGAANRMSNLFRIQSRQMSSPNIRNH
jgi:hypothetical protein